MSRTTKISNMMSINNDIVHSPVLLGESLRRLRVSRDMTVQQAADAARLSKSFISLVESGKRSISFEDLLRLVHALGMSLGRFVSLTRDSFAQSSLDAPLEAALTSIVQKREEGLLLAGNKFFQQNTLDKKSKTLASQPKYTPRLTLLRPVRYEHDLEICELLLPPASQLTEEPITMLPPTKHIQHEVRGVVQSGTLLLVLDNDEYRAKTGDEFCFDGVTPHLYRNYTADTTTATIIITNAGL